MRAPASQDATRVADAHAHLAAARAAGARGPGPQAEELRSAYLDLLKLCLCDLAGATTLSVGAMADGTVMSRELRGEAMRLRSAGMDWPLQGLTMIGLRRLDDLQACVESVVSDGVEGDLIEAGAWRGGAAILMRATLDCLGEDRTVWVADSFQGFPETDPPSDGSLDLSAFDFLAVPLEEVRASFVRFGLNRRVRFVPGFFEDTLAGLVAEQWAIARVDADTYEATRDALSCLYPGLSVGGYLVVDDYSSFDGCRRAVDEYRRDHGIHEPLEKVDYTCVRWRRETAGGPATPPRPSAVDRSSTPLGGPDALERRQAAAVPTARELQLTRALADARARLAAAEAQIAPSRAPRRLELRAWLRRTLSRRARR
jgi:hypothetical protein